MTDVFFTATKRALNNITSNYDMVWPTAVGLWNLRCMVNGVKKEFPEITEAELATKFSQGSGSELSTSVYSNNMDATANKIRLDSVK